MRNRITAFVAGVLLTVAAGVLAQSSGFPSRPRFQAVTVAGAPPATYGQVGLRGNAVGASAVSFLSFSDSAGTRTGFIGDDSAANSGIKIENSVSGAELRLSTTGGGAITANGSAICRADGTGCPTGLKSSRGTVGLSGACTASGVGMANGACTYAGAGIAGVSLAAAAYTATPACAVTLSGLGATTTSSIFIDSIAGSAPNYTLNVSVRKNGAALADGNFHVLCIGV